ncbi:MAG: cytochrome c biogenesis protein CcsA, partial [Bdellovibrionales bacterium]|nr:cytochrome c biogenesis protein CcsA [Bdellovibrionales bacterium]
MKDSYGKATSGKIAISIVYLLVLYALYLTFIVAPPERFMGAVQRIFYFHVGSAVATYCAFGVLLCAALSYLGLKNNLAKFYLRAGSETSLLFASITLASGMIWAHSAWNVWFRWEPRLVTFLLLWLISLSIVLLWKFGSEQSVTKHASVLSILGSLMVPIVVYAI